MDGALEEGLKGASFFPHRTGGNEMTKVGQVYECEICGNKVNIVEAGDGTLVCCGQEMTLIS
jgi:desulfoferrodoxin-like iron-binding protein